MNCLSLLAESSAVPAWLEVLARPTVLPFLIPIVGIIGGISCAITGSIIRHRERMAKIQNGIDPDAEPTKK